MTRTCAYCGETSPATLSNCPSCGRSFATGMIEQVMTPPRGTSANGGDAQGDGSDALYTKLALRAVDLSDTFNAVFSQPMPGWRVEMGRPGMSTAGGKQALQHIGLRGRDGGTLVVGSVDATASEVELRSWRRVDTMYRERYGRALPIRSVDWDRFVERVGEFFREEGMTVRIETRPPGQAWDEADEPAGGAPAASVLWMIVAVVSTALIAGAITWFVLTRDAPPPPPAWPVPVAPAPMPQLPAPPP